MHNNSLAAWHSIDTGTRAYQICERLASIGTPCTDRQLCESLGFGDMNAVRPRITALVTSRHLAEVDSVPCPVTGRRVRRVWFAPVQETLFG